MVGSIGGPPDIGRAESAQVRSAAIQFEALWISEVLRSSRESGGGWLGGGDATSSSALGEFGEQAFAQLLSQQGGLGLQPLIEQGLSKKADEQLQAQREAKAPPGEAAVTPAWASLR